MFFCSLQIWRLSPQLQGRVCWCLAGGAWSATLTTWETLWWLWPGPYPVVSWLHICTTSGQTPSALISWVKVQDEACSHMSSAPEEWHNFLHLVQVHDARGTHMETWCDNEQCTCAFCQWVCKGLVKSNFTLRRSLAVLTSRSHWSNKYGSKVKERSKTWRIGVCGNFLEMCGFEVTKIPQNRNFCNRIKMVWKD